MNFTPEKVPEECEERHYWHKRFNFASWLFLLFSFWALFTDNFNSGLMSLAVSMGFQFFNSWHQIRHMKWHIKQDEGTHK